MRETQKRDTKRERSLDRIRTILKSTDSSILLLKTLADSLGGDRVLHGLRDGAKERSGRVLGTTDIVTETVVLLVVSQLLTDLTVKRLELSKLGGLLFLDGGFELSDNRKTDWEKREEGERESVRKGEDERVRKVREAKQRG